MKMNSSSFINTNPILLSLRLSSGAGLGHTSVCCVARCLLVKLAVGQGCPTWIPVSWHSCQAHQDWHPQPSEGLLGGAWFITWCLRHPILEECRQSLKYFWSRCVGLGKALSPDQPKKGLVPHMSAWWDVWQIPQNPNKLNPIYFIYMYKEDLALDNLQGLICHKTKTIPT